MLRATPCRLCGYDAPAATCPHCGHSSSDPSLRDERVGGLRALVDGFRAVPNGLYLLATTRGVKRWLVPPVLLTFAAFVALFVWTLGLVDVLVGLATPEDVQELGLHWHWLEVALLWLVKKGVATFLAKLTGILLWILVSSVVALYAFSIVYEAIAGPFLDEIQGRIEQRWFGRDPRDDLERPTALPTSRCVRLSLLAGVPALALLLAAWLVPGWPGWLLLLAVPTPFLFAGQVQPEYGRWLGWVVRLEGHTLWVSIKASLMVGVLLVVCLPLKFVPVLGLPLFMAIAGFGTAITLLDIPFSRRGWPLGMRLEFMLENWLALTAFGGVASFLFLIPVLGPLVMVPGASIGGLWLVVRLDKDTLRPRELRRGAAG